MDCIYGWTKYSNVCPLCKITITQLQIFNALKPEEVHEIIEVPEPIKPDTDAMGDWVAEFAEVCYICRR